MTKKNSLHFFNVIFWKKDIIFKFKYLPSFMINLSYWNSYLNNVLTSLFRIPPFWSTVLWSHELNAQISLFLHFWCKYDVQFAKNATRNTQFQRFLKVCSVLYVLICDHLLYITFTWSNSQYKRSTHLVILRILRTITEKCLTCFNFFKSTF